MKAPVTILYLITSTNAGGTEKALFQLISRIDRKRFAVYVCSLKQPGLFAQKIAAASDGFFSLGLSEAGGMRAAVNFLPALFRLLSILRQIKPSIIHAFLFRANIMGRLAGRLAGVPIIISSIRVLEAGPWYKHLIDRLTAAMVDKYIAVSEAVRQFTLSQVHLPENKIITIYNGIDCTNVPEKPSERLMVNGCCCNIILAGRFERQKGHAVFIKALKLLRQQHTNFKAYLFGEGPDERLVRDMVAREGLADQVMFMGVVDNILPHMLQMNICVLPSLWEGLPNVLLEAMAAACPIVATRIPGVDEIVLDGQTGILCEPGNAPALADALLRLIRNPELGRAVAAAGRLRVEQRFSLETTVRETGAVYDQLLRHTCCPAGAETK